MRLTIIEDKDALHANVRAFATDKGLGVGAATDFLCQYALNRMAALKKDADKRPPASKKEAKPKAAKPPKEPRAAKPQTTPKASPKHVNGEAKTAQTEAKNGETYTIPPNKGQEPFLNRCQIAFSQIDSLVVLDNALIEWQKRAINPKENDQVCSIYEARKQELVKGSNVVSLPQKSKFSIEEATARLEGCTTISGLDGVRKSLLETSGDLAPTKDQIRETEIVYYRYLDALRAKEKAKEEAQKTSKQPAKEEKKKEPNAKAQPKEQKAQKKPAKATKGTSKKNQKAAPRKKKAHH